MEKTVSDVDLRQLTSKPNLRKISCLSCNSLLVLLDLDALDGDGILMCKKCGAHNAFVAQSGKIEVDMG